MAYLDPCASARDLSGQALHAVYVVAALGVLAIVAGCADTAHYPLSGLAVSASDPVHQLSMTGGTLGMVGF